ncbi:MAG TPA: phospholipase D family protein [Verrucomicrobiae bacterium]|nr:phospholipase D family protein [Verrucomicrobiae bacterium]
MTTNPTINRQQQFELIDRDWGAVLDQAAANDHSELRIICPFIKRNPIDRLLRSGRPSVIQVLTRFNLDGFCLGVSDLSALRLVLECGGQIKGVRNLHAKLYLFGRSRAVLTSANLTGAALQRNHEFGFSAAETQAVQNCRNYFDRLWPKAGEILTEARLKNWEPRVEKWQTQGGGIVTREKLPDEGTDLGFDPPTSDVSPVADFSSQAFVKFFGKDERATPATKIFEEVDRSGSHWACSYPKNKRPRQVQDGDVMFIGRLARNPRDILIYGRAIAKHYREGLDDATVSDKQRRDWKGDWPHYIRVHHPEFIAGTLANAISLYRLMADLGSDSFASTRENAAAGVGNQDPRKAIREQPHVRLSAFGYAWLKREFENALALHGHISEVELAKLDWPPAHST